MNFWHNESTLFCEDNEFVPITPTRDCRKYNENRTLILRRVFTHKSRTELEYEIDFFDWAHESRITHSKLTKTSLNTVRAFPVIGAPTCSIGHAAVCFSPRQTTAHLNSKTGRIISGSELSFTLPSLSLLDPSDPGFFSTSVSVVAVLGFLGPWPSHPILFPAERLFQFFSKLWVHATQGINWTKNSHLRQSWLEK